MNLNFIAIGKYIQDGRKHYEMTHAELAEKLGVSPQSVSNWERGESLPDVALSALIRIGELLGHDHPVWKLMMEGINNGMNATIEDAFTDPKMFELFAGEFLIQCVRNGDYADPRDVIAHMQPSQCRDYILRVLEEVGIR